MELLPRYLNAVRGYLPKSQQADVIAELSDSIQSQMEEKERELGHSLNRDEESAILKTYGHPILVASRYRPHQQLIGPALYPFYVHSLRLVLSIALAVTILAAIIVSLATDDPLAAAVHTWGAAWGTFFVVVGVLTIIFAAVERLQPKDNYTERWDPRSLPAVKDAQPISRFGLVLEIAIYAAVVLWLLDVPSARQAIGMIMLGPAAADIRIPFVFTPVWYPMYLAVIIESFIFIAVDCVNLIRPDWTRLRAGAFCVTSIILLIGAGFTFHNHGLVAVAAGVPDAARYAKVARIFNMIAFVWGGAFVIYFLMTIVVNLRRLLRRSDREPLNIHSNAEAR